MADVTPAESQQLRPISRLPSSRRPWVGFPAALPPFIGRTQQVLELLALLRHSERRLITLTGPGGVGKTRLAIVAATRAAAEFPDGAVFVPLAGVRDASHVLSAIARACEVREILERPLADTLGDALRDSCLLLVLDNFEHVLPAARDLDALLTVCPRLTTLVTSRSPLRLGVEQRFLTPPLTVPTSDELTVADAIGDFEAVELFAERARSVSHEFVLDNRNIAAVIGICRQLDGLPLAIELAAAWVRVLPPASLLARLNLRLPLLHGDMVDQPARFRTMRETIAWSYDLLGEDEARLFRQLAVFVGGFSLADAERMVSAYLASGGPEIPENSESDPPNVLDLLAALIDKSLIQPAHIDAHEPRYQMLETVREFTLERLQEQGEADAAATAHAAIFLDWSERLEPVLLGPDEQYWHERIDAELGNLRVALAWGLAYRVESTLRIASALWIYWAWYQLAEGRRWLTAALDRSPHAPFLVRARALTTDGALAALEGNHLESLGRAQDAVVLAQSSGDPLTEARARWIAACAWLYTNRVQDAVPELDRALALFSHAASTTDRTWGAYARANRAGAAAWLGDPALAVTLFEDALTQARAAGSNGMILAILCDFAGLLIELGEQERAREMLREALNRISRRSGYWLAGTALLSLAMLDVNQGDPVTAARRLGAADAVLILAGVDIPTHILARITHATAQTKIALGQESFAVGWAAGKQDPETVIQEAVTPPQFPAQRPGNADVPDYGLSQREHHVLRLLADGLTDKEIAGSLFISRRTASKHVAAILSKLGVDSRTAAVATALRRGLL